MDAFYCKQIIPQQILVFGKKKKKEQKIQKEKNRLLKDQAH